MSLTARDKERHTNDPSRAVRVIRTRQLTEDNDVNPNSIYGIYGHSGLPFFPAAYRMGNLSPDPAGALIRHMGIPYVGFE
jgi:hypothetical protein